MSLCNIVVSVWAKEEIVLEQHWNKTLICLLHKNGDRLDCPNYISSLIRSAYKVLSNIPFSRLLIYSEREIGKQQCGFIKGTSSIEQILTLMMILQKGLEYKLSTHNLFVDFKAAYDNIIATGSTRQCSTLIFQ